MKNTQDNFISGIGNTPLIKLRAASEITGCNIYGKAEFMNPGGSVKDRAALALIKDAEDKKLISKGGTIVEGTAGNTGIGLCLLGNSLGYKTIIVMNESQTQEKCQLLSLKCFFCQSNNEGDLINFIQSAEKNYDGLIINPAAFTHTSVALLDALRSISKPKIEIHLSNIYNREDYRKKSITSEGVNGLICGFGSLSYILAVEAISKLIYKE